MRIILEHFWRCILVVSLLTACTAKNPNTSAPNPEPKSAPKSAPISPCQIGTAGRYDMAALLKAKETEYTSWQDDDVNRLAIDLLACLGDPDPNIRDGLVYASLRMLLRAERITPKTQQVLFEDLIKVLSGPKTHDGFARPFAALNLSELARADRITPFLTDEQRAKFVRSVSAYMISIDDYRGFSDQEGWRHGIAHTSDIMLHLSLNPNITKGQVLELRDALGKQIAPTDHAYIHGEPERMARAVLYMARRGEIRAENWQNWMDRLAQPAPLASWADAYTSQAGLAKLNNTKAFLGHIYINANESGNANMKVLFAPARTALGQLP